MPIEAEYETVPDDEDLLYSIEHWDREKIEEEFPDPLPVKSDEAFVHPRTGTAARIRKRDSGTYTVQATMGDFASFDCVVQSDDPAEATSGGAAVVAIDVESLPKARMLALTWLKGWLHRNSHVGESAGDIVDTEW